MPRPSFDHIATDYDAQFTNTAVGRLQRAVVQAYLETKTKPGIAVLELNCGTGEDAIWLAQKGCTVLATDISSQMVAATAAKVQQANQGHRIQTQVLDIRNISPDRFRKIASRARFLTPRRLPEAPSKPSAEKGKIAPVESSINKSVS